MTEPWRIHVCPAHGPRTPTMLGDCPVGCCDAVMEVVRVVRDTRGDRLDVLAHYERLGCNIGKPIGGGVAGLDPVIATARTEADAEKIVRALNALGAVKDRDELADVLRRYAEWSIARGDGVPGFAIAAITDPIGGQ